MKQNSFWNEANRGCQKLLLDGKKMNMAILTEIIVNQAW